MIRELSVLLLIFSSLLQFVTSFGNYRVSKASNTFQWSSVQQSSLIKRTTTQLYMASASSSLIRKNKIKEVEALKKSMEEEGDDHIVTKFLKTGERPYGCDIRVPFNKTIVQTRNTLSVVCEYNRKAKTGFIMGLPPPEIMGGVIRDAGCKAVIASMDKKVGAVPVDEFRRLMKEQYAARKFTPPSIAVVWSDYIVDELQVIQAAAYGASAIVIDLDVITDELPQLIQTSKKYDMDPVVFIKNLDEGKKAIDAGARILCMRNLAEQGYVKLKNDISALPNSENLTYIAKLKAETDFSIYTEIDIAWVLRDEGFHCVWPSPEAVFATTISDIYANCLALKSKASRIYLSPRQFLMDRNKEGAKEFLGNIYF